MVGIFEFQTIVWCGVLGNLLFFVVIFFLKRKCKTYKKISIFLRDFKNVSRFYAYRIVYSDYIETRKPRYKKGLKKILNPLFSKDEACGVARVVIDFYYDCNKLHEIENKIIFPPCSRCYSYDSKKLNYDVGKKGKFLCIFGSNTNKDVRLQEGFKDELIEQANKFVEEKIDEYNIYENMENRVRSYMEVLNKDFVVEFQRGK